MGYSPKIHRNLDLANHTHTHGIINLTKLIEDSTSRVNPNVNCELWIIMICQSRCISCKTRIRLVEDVDLGESHVCVSVGGFEKSLYYSFNFSVNIKLL